ncbi:hypothetical protein [Herbidospora mongoliensis]|uniref:hypothetical protein n=1 Tax=Herbidospora mongoliensis TaxID=688067 RepID=UPI0012FCC62C|nr:hypothetical protein [Herbidospora mongoliensis]
MTPYDLVREVVAELPELEGFHRKHLRDNGVVLPHVFFCLLADLPSRQRVAAYLETVFDSLDADARGVVDAGFVWSLQGGPDVVLGERLRAIHERILRTGI